jgi:hypothetical protein
VAACAALVLAGCSGGNADTGEVGAQKAACKSAPDFSLGPLGDAPAPVVYRPAAPPPEPVGELLPKARFVVAADVGRVVYQGSPPSRAHTKKNLAGPIPPERCQVVRLDITGVVSGDDPGSSLTVVKPLAPYLLREGESTAGKVFLMEAGDPYPIILGRYGPYPIGEVQAALAGGQ